MNGWLDIPKREIATRVKCRQTDGNESKGECGIEIKSKRGTRKQQRQVNELMKEVSYTPPSSTPRMSATSAKSAKNGVISVSSVS
jgi:hypothetical protein